MDLPFSSYDDSPSSSTRLLNCHIEQGGDQAIGPVLAASPGVAVDRELGVGPIRALGTMRGDLFTVSGEKLYKNNTLVGNVPGVNRPQIACNTFQLCVLVEPYAWIYDADTDTLTQITDPDFMARGASSVQFFDNYLTFTEPNSGRWFSSNLAAAEAYDSLLFATAEGAPDDLLTHVVDHRQALLLGRESCELWDNVGTSGFPFARNPNGFIEIGCAAKYSAVKVDQSVIWVASDLTVRRLQGITPVRISTHAVERFIQSATVQDCYGMTFTWDGHVFYVMTFPEGTWVFDVTSGKWHERKSHGLDNWQASCATTLNGQTYVGGNTNQLGILADTFTEWGNPMVASWTYAPVFSGEYVNHSRLEIFAESGVGLIEGQGSDPEIMLEISNDGGRTYHHLPTRKLGQIGQYQQRAVWNRLGRSRNRVYRPSISDPVRRKIVATRLDTA